MRLITGFFCIAISTVSWAAQAGAVDTRKILLDIASKCGKAKAYAFEGDLQIVGQSGENPARVLSKARVRLAVAPGGKSLLHVAPVDKDEYLLVSNGAKSWAYVPKLKQYTETDGGSVVADGEEEEEQEGGSSDERDLAEKFSRLVMTVMGEMVKSPKAVGVKPAEAVKYEGKKYMWPVVQSLSKQSADGQSLTEVTVDPETMRIGRLMWSYGRGTGAEHSVIQMTVDFERFQAGEPPPESTFEFDPPKKSKRVDSVPIPGQTGSFLLNQAAPDFEARTLSGDKVRLAELRDRTVVLNFWASWCGPCRRELPTISKLHEELKDKGLVVLGVNDEGRDDAREYVQTTGLKFPTLDDSARKLHRLYRVTNIPSIFIIGRDGKVVRFLRGAHEEAELRAALKSAGF